MIAQVLSRSFLLTWLDAVEESLSGLADSGDPDGEYAAALDGIKQVKKSGVQGQEDEGDGGRRSGWDDESTLDEQSFFSRDPVMSLLQSAVEELIEDKYSGLIIDDDPTDRRDAGGAVSPVTGRRLDIGDDLQFDSERRLFGPFEVTDVGWVASVGLAKALQMFRDRHPFNPRPAAPVQLADRSRLVIVGDWGSGLPRAQQVAQHMRVAIDHGIADGRQVHAIHLGDVYYSGFAREYKNRFLRYWPVREDEADTVYSWSLNGNHDMYSGGHGYFKTLLADPRFACQQRSSWFSIENKHWRIVGIDTAWDEEGIHDPRTERGLQDPQAATLAELGQRGRSAVHASQPSPVVQRVRAPRTLTAQQAGAAAGRRPDPRMAMGPRTQVRGPRALRRCRVRALHRARRGAGVRDRRRRRRRATHRMGRAAGHRRTDRAAGRCSASPSPTSTDHT